MVPQSSRAESQCFCKVPCSKFQCFLMQGDQWQHVNLLSADNSTLPSIFSTKIHFDDLLLFAGKLNTFSHHFQSFNFKKMFIVQNASMRLQNLPSFYIITLQAKRFIDFFQKYAFRETTLHRTLETILMLKLFTRLNTGIVSSALPLSRWTFLNWFLERWCIQLETELVIDGIFDYILAH